MQMPIMRNFTQKSEFSRLKCGKLRWKCEKLAIFQGFGRWDFNFSTHATRGKVENPHRYYTNAENWGVEKNKFSTFHLTEIMQKKAFYSFLKTLFLYKLHKNQARFKNINAPRLKNMIDKMICSIYTSIDAKICRCSCMLLGCIIILMTENSTNTIAKKSSLIT